MNKRVVTMFACKFILFFECEDFLFNNKTAQHYNNSVFELKLLVIIVIHFNKHRKTEAQIQPLEVLPKPKLTHILKSSVVLSWWAIQIAWMKLL